LQNKVVFNLTLGHNHCVRIDKGYIMFAFVENLVKKAIDGGLTEREVMIVLDRARGVTLREIASDEGVTPERIRQIEARALRKLTRVACR
jgi:DNA-directed RNA polymerase sigma subunit (sigma70/sigma32)